MLDNTHSVFGEVVGNIKILEDIEKIGSDDKEKPKREIKIISVEVYSNPFRDLISETLIKELTSRSSHESEYYGRNRKEAETNLDGSEDGETSRQ